MKVGNPWAETFFTPVLGGEADTDKIKKLKNVNTYKNKNKREAKIYADKKMSGI